MLKYKLTWVLKLDEVDSPFSELTQSSFVVFTSSYSASVSPLTSSFSTMHSDPSQTVKVSAKLDPQ